MDVPLSPRFSHKNNRLGRARDQRTGQSSERGLVAFPKLRIRLKKCDADAQPSFESLADVDHPAFALGLIFSVSEEKPLAWRDIFRK